jgi:spore germination protein YaaH
MINRVSFIFLTLSFVFFSLTCVSVSPARSADPAYEFNEIWGYLMKGEERHLTDDIPVTDVGYFSAEISRTGKFYGAPERNKLKSYKGRVHLVVASIGNYTLTHICINPEYKKRNRLIRDIVKASKDFDGVQIDFESVIPADKELFIRFLSLLKKELKGKTLSVAVPARRGYVKDAFDYSRIGKIADRVIIMAYDQHWSTSGPGPVSSLNWCSLVSEYAVSKIPSEKIVMGIPFYGRAWIDENPARAYRLESTRRIIEKIKPEIKHTEDGIPFFTYSITVNVSHYFEDENTIADKLKLYQSRSINNAAFWRISQETPEIWDIITNSR